MNAVRPSDFTDIVMTATADVITLAIATAINADRLVWHSEPQPCRDDRIRVRLILRNP